MRSIPVIYGASALVLGAVAAPVSQKSGLANLSTTESEAPALGDRYSDVFSELNLSARVLDEVEADVDERLGSQRLFFYYFFACADFPMRFISVITVSSALLLAVSAAPVPEENGLNGSDVFAELNLTVRDPSPQLPVRSTLHE
ncbi:hypothetical protein DFH07DRAFT_1063620 [Mycena maculata]|uniref:Uncharacterized protein n=1 Tax=Mycena maculata TaxID=230809 RepID=A0AAD7IJE0_9AGAR|nr:hypothetical protein DFH07DRAFT_1063620 [Mycena maculata]